MKRTIKEVYKIIEDKRDDALLGRDRMYQIKDYGAVNRYCGNIEAYTDILCLIYSSHLLEEDDK